MYAEIQAGRYDPAAYVAYVLTKQKKLAERRRREEEAYERLRHTTAEPWRGVDAAFKPEMWFRADTWSAYDLFPDLPACPHDGYFLSREQWDKYAVKCPGTNFYYCKKTLPLGYSLAVEPHVGQKGLAFFDGPVVMPVLFEQTGPEGGFEQEVWMSITPMEVMTQKTGLDMARGRCVVGGLGLGWFLSELAARPAVTEIVVTDVRPELIEWLRPRLCEMFPKVAEKVTAWLPVDVYKFMGLEALNRTDTVYLLDIWPTYGDADHDNQFVYFETAVGRDRVWGWGRGATFGGKVPDMKANAKLHDPRSYARRKPCSGCPFRRDAVEDKCGGVDPLRLIGQTVGPFILHCHQEPGYEEKRLRRESLEDLAQCAGAATYRANVGVSNLPEVLHALPADTETVYATPAELLAGVGKIPLARAEAILAERPPRDLYLAELARSGARTMGAVRTDSN